MEKGHCMLSEKHTAFLYYSGEENRHILCVGYNKAILKNYFKYESLNTCI